MTGLAALTTYQMSVVARDGAGASSPPSGAVSVTTLSQEGACRVGYSTNDWGGGFTATVTITNTGATALSSWTLAFDLTAGQRLQQGWSAIWAQEGTRVTARNQSWNGTLAAGASVGIGFNGSHTGSNPRPTAFSINGSACTIG